MYIFINKACTHIIHSIVKIMSLSKDTNKKWLEVKTWLNDELEIFKTPRQSDVIEKGKKVGLSKAKTIKLLKQDFTSYRDVSRPNYSMPRKKYRTYVGSFFNTVSCDLAFFGYLNPELRKLGVSKIESNGCLIMIVVATRYMIAIPLGPLGKTAKGLKNALNKGFEIYKTRYKMYPTRCLWDQEKAVTSKLVLDFFNEKTCKLFLYKFSRTKALFAELSIRNLRQSLSLLRKHHKKSIKWHQILNNIVQGYNERKIVLHGKRMTFTPNDITPKNFYLYQDEINKKFKKYSLLSFSIDPSLFTFKFPVGSLVKLKNRAINVPGLQQKLSEQPISETIWIVKRHAVYLTSKNDILKKLFLQLQNGTSIIQLEEEACIPI